MAAQPNVVVIVLNWCGEQDTIACVESLERSTYRQLDILLVDNASPDGSGDRLRSRFPTLPYLQTGKNQGYAGGNNRGFEHATAATADYVVVLNNDTEVDERCVEWLVQTAEETGAALVAPKILHHEDPDVVWYAGGDFSAFRAMGLHRGLGLRDSAGEARQEPISFATGCCFLIRRDVLGQVGGFDESYFAYIEDVELSVRLARARFKLVYESRARVLHKIPIRAAGETPFQIRQRDRNRRRLARTHFGPMRRAAFAAWFYPTRAIHFARYALTGTWPQAAAVLTGAFGSLDPAASAATDISTRVSRSRSGA